MREDRIKVLIINGIADDGSVRRLRADNRGRASFSTGGGCHVSSYLPRDRFDVTIFILDHHLRQQVSRSFVLSHDVVFCEIADPDSHAISLKKTQDLYDALHDRIPWINNPHNVPRTRRSSIPPLLAGLDGVTAPATIRLRLESVEKFASAIEAAGLSLPVLIRPSGSHGGDGLRRIERLSDLAGLNLSRYDDAFVTDYCDYSQDALFSKYRLAVVQGEPLLRHVIFSDSWMIHSEARAFMAKHPELERREARIIEAFEEDLKKRLDGRVRAIHERVGLDYFGIDCGVKDDALILFEVNAVMNILDNNQPLPNIWEGQIDRILQGLMTLIGERVRSGP